MNIRTSCSLGAAYAAAMLLLVFAFVQQIPAQVVAAERVTLPTRIAEASSTLVSSTLVEAGALPGSQMMQLTIRLSPGAAGRAALEELLADQATAGSANYRRWITPQEFATQFGATEEQIAAVSQWLEAQGLRVSAVSPSKLRLSVTGTAAQVQAAFDVTLKQYQSGGTVFFANANQPSLPESMAATSMGGGVAGGGIAGVDGLDDLPSAHPITVNAASTVADSGGATAASAASAGSAGASAGSAASASPADALRALAGVVDANATGIVTLTTTACSTEFAQADDDAYRDLFRQANAQGITVLATSGCGARGSGSFPASLVEATAVALPGGTAWATFAGIDARPTWQFAPGLPADGERVEPDLTVSSVAALVSTLTSIQQSVGKRVGNINAVLYELAPLPDLYTQPDAPVSGEVASGSWEPATGLGLVNLAMLAKVFPRDVIGTSSLLTVSPPSTTHGAPVTFTAAVTSTGGSGIPTGTVSFVATYSVLPHGTQGASTTLGSGTLNASGVATFSTNTLAGGYYTLTSVYSGDATYTGSTSGTYTLTVAGEPSIMTATVAAGAVVGGNATINVSVTSASGVGTPSGTVIAAPQGTTNTATASAPISGSNGTAIGTISLPVSQAGTFTILVSCSDPDPSFTCNSPVSVQATIGTATATLTASLSPATSVPYGSNAALTVTAAYPNATAAPQGSITASIMGVAGAAFTSTLTAAAAGTAASATFSIPAPVPGTYSIQVSCPAAGTLVCNGPITQPLVTVKGVSATTLTLNPATPLAGEKTVLTAMMASAGGGTGAYIYTGTVAFYANTTLLGTGTVSGGTASISAVLPAGSAQSLTAVYSGDADWATSTSAAVPVDLAAVPSMTVVTSNVSSPLAGVQVILTATVSSAAAMGVAPTGTVTFYDTYNGTLLMLGSAALVPNGISSAAANLTPTSQLAGNNTVYAIYSGDTVYGGSTSPLFALAFSGYGATFMPSTLTLTPGQTGQSSVLVNLLGGFSGTVSLGCMPPASAELTCSFKPSTLTASGTATLTVVSVAPSNSTSSRGDAPARPGKLRGEAEMAGRSSLALLVLLVLPRRKRRLSATLLAMLLAATLMAASGCGSGSSTSTSAQSGSPLGSQILTITTAATNGDNTVTQTYFFQVNVE
jgi:trimeric autotransporter adhesin